MFFGTTLCTTLAGQGRPIPAYVHPIPYQPLSYVCYYAAQPVPIDGVLGPEWDAAPWSTLFGDIQGSIKPSPPLLTRFKMMWDSSHLYLAFWLQEPNLWATLTQRDTVIYYDNDIEIFIDPDGDTHHYFEFELNALATLWDLLLVRPYRDMSPGGAFNAWDARSMRWAVKCYGTLNNNLDTDSAWSAEMAIPLELLAEGNEHSQIPREGDRWRMNFSRVHHDLDKIGSSYRLRAGADGKSLPEHNWSWSPQGRINMHEPEQWGYVQFTQVRVGTDHINFTPDPDLALCWHLRQIYYQQKEFKKIHGQYAIDLKLLNLPRPPSGAELNWEVGAHQYLVEAKSYDSGLTWFIQHDGRVWSPKKP